MWTSKLTVLLLCVCLLKSRLVSAQSDMMISLKVKDVSLENALKEIRARTHYSYGGKGDWPQMSHPVSVDVVKASLTEVLDLCFKDQPLYYTIDTLQHLIDVHIRTAEEWDVHGFVYDENKIPVYGANIKAAEENGTTTAENGEFTLHLHHTNVRFSVSSLAYETQTVPMPERDRDVIVLLRSRARSLEAVVVHTGYQDVRRGNTAGSVDLIDNGLLNRRVSTNILDRIDGVASSVLFNKNVVNSVNQSTITIRGRSTIFANPNPLIVVDNFPYPGDLNNINPADVESITILKDAAAASIWGAYSGNGVIVITTKKGKPNQAPHFSFTSSLQVGQKPNLYYQPILSSSDYIDIEEFLYNHGNYGNDLALPPGFSPALSPVIEALDSTAQGLLSPAGSAAEINAYRKMDTRRDLNKYFYQPSINSQYALNVSGGGSTDQYYLSAGYDQNISNEVRNQYDRLTLLGNNTHELIPGRLELTTGFGFTASSTYYNNAGGSGVIYPYVPLADVHGNPLAVPFVLRMPYVNSLSGGPLLDWHYRPLQELQNADNKLNLTDYRINIGLQYSILKGLDARLSYQYGRGDSDLVLYYSPQTWFDRNMVNSYTQILSGNQIITPVPRGGIMDETDDAYTVNNIRGQLNYSTDSLFHGRFNVIGGWELRDLQGNDNTNWLYGYDPTTGSSMPVDYVNSYPANPSGLPQQIPYQNTKVGTEERYISYYTNAGYTYKDRYMFTGSARLDESNLFGVRTNQKAVPLGSVGLAWDISQEDFYHFDKVLPFLKLRITDGYNGNVDRNISAYTTATLNSGINAYNAVTATVVNPPDPTLRWEKIHIYNFGLDFASDKNRVSGTVEYYIKSGIDLIGQSPVDPTTGVTVFTGNTANMRDHGVDLTLRTDNSFGTFRWNSTLLFSYVLDKVTKYDEKLGQVSDYFNPTTVNPLAGKPLYSVYALRWGGLTADSGNPTGILNGKATEAYGTLLDTNALNTMVYKGPANPPVFGSWRNTFYWKQWGFSFNILYKLGYVFRRNSMFYSAVFAGNSAGSPDYEKRWQKPGDEKITNVPSMVYPANTNRDEFYQYSDILVVPGDHVRLQDVQLSYDLTKQAHPRLPVQVLRFYLYANNLGILWKANHVGIDPDYVSGMPNPRTLALGIKVDY
jgi:TonB-linked SusC/RagA family outer membrane protein